MNLTLPRIYTQLSFVWSPNEIIFSMFVFQGDAHILQKWSRKQIGNMHAVDWCSLMKLFSNSCVLKSGKLGCLPYIFRGNARNMDSSTVQFLWTLPEPLPFPKHCERSPWRSEGEAEAGNKSLGAGEVTTQEDGGRERNKKASLPLLASSGAVSSRVWLDKWLRQTLTSVLPAFGLWRWAPDRAPLCCAWVSGMCSCPSFPHTLLGRKSCIFERPGKFRGAPLFWI